RLARTLATDSKMDLWDAARMFALLNMSLVDSYIAVWDSKYHFNHWRPYTAIRARQSDGNSLTSPDSQWESLRPAPPFPEYVSAHAAGCASAFRVLEEFFPKIATFTMDSKTAPRGMPTRSFESFRAASRECSDSRVMLGFHFRYATERGEELGRNIAEYVLVNRLGRNAP
ncbi:MAG: vanadium-dependent haloperoxidase, partial [Steroidobacter sp.]